MMFPKGASFTQLVRVELPRRRGGIDCVLQTERSLNRSRQEKNKREKNRCRSGLIDDPEN